MKTDLEKLRRLMGEIVDLSGHADDNRIDQPYATIIAMTTKATDALAMLDNMEEQPYITPEMLENFELTPELRAFYKEAFEAFDRAEEPEDAKRPDDCVFEELHVFADGTYSYGEYTGNQIKQVLDWAEHLESENAQLREGQKECKRLLGVLIDDVESHFLCNHWMILNRLKKIDVVLVVPDEEARR